MILIVVLAIAAIWYFEGNSGGDDDVDTSAEIDDSVGDNSDDGGEVTDTNSISGFISKWARAIAPAENVNPAYNNPGGLNMQGDLGSTPAAGGTGHDVIGIFSSLTAGYNALENTLSKYVTKYPDATLLQATGIYVLGPNDPRVISGNLPQNVVNEAQKVASALGVSINSTLSGLAG